MLLSRKQDKLYVFKPQFKTYNETANRENKLMIENKTS